MSRTEDAQRILTLLEEIADKLSDIYNAITAMHEDQIANLPPKT